MKKLDKLEKVAKKLADIKAKSGIPNPVLAKKMFPHLDEQAALSKFNYHIYGRGKLGYEELYLLSKAMEDLAQEIINSVHSYREIEQKIKKRKAFILEYLDELAENEKIDAFIKEKESK